MTRFALLAAASSLAFIAPASAQQEDDEIVITATKTARTLDDIPASVSVVDAGQLSLAGGPDDAQDITRYLTGVQTAVANGTQVAWQIRGIGAVDHQALTPGAAAVYADGVFLATNVQTGFMTYDLARVEVLKGPQGSLYGRNASSGAINVISARPGEGAPSYVAADLGSHDRVSLAGAVETALSETLALRVAGRSFTQGPVLDNVETDPDFPAGPDEAGGERDEIGLRATLRWQPGTADVLWRTHYEEDNGINVAPRNDALDVGDHEISIGPDGIQDTDNEFYGTAVEVTLPLGAWDLYSLSAFEGYDQEYGFDFDGAPAPFSTASLNANLSYNRDFRQFSEELRLSRDWASGRVSGDSLVGLALSTDDFSQDYLIWCGVFDEATFAGTCPYVGAPGRVGPTPASDGTPLSLVNQIEQQRDMAALFTYNDIQLTERLAATLGLRYTTETIEGSGYGYHVFDDGTRALNDRDGLGPAIGENEIDEDRVTGTLALRYDLTDDLTGWVSVANGYKSGGFNGEVINNATHFADEGLFAAETVTSCEAGLRGARGERLSYALTAFWQDYQDPQARIFVDFPQPDGSVITSNSLSNLDEATSYGVEAEATLRPVAGLDLTGGVTLLETEISQGSDGAAGNADAFDGNPLPFAANVTAFATARYQRPVGEDRRVGLAANISHKDEYYLDAEGLDTRREDGYTLVDAEASLYLDAQALTFSVWGKNLTDEDYAISGYGFIGYNTFRSSPRQYGVSVRKTF